MNSVSPLINEEKTGENLHLIRESLSFINYHFLANTSLSSCLLRSEIFFQGGRVCNITTMHSMFIKWPFVSNYTFIYLFFIKSSFNKNNSTFFNVSFCISCTCILGILQLDVFCFCFACHCAIKLISIIIILLRSLIPVMHRMWVVFVQWILSKRLTKRSFVTLWSFGGDI